MSCIIIVHALPLKLMYVPKIYATILNMWFIYLPINYRKCNFDHLSPLCIPFTHVHTCCCPGSCTGDGGCSHICVVVNNVEMCFCPDGLVLAPDGLTCHGEYLFETHHILYTIIATYFSLLYNFNFRF